MASIEVLVGPSLTGRAVEATPFLAGLVQHKTPDAPPPHNLYNITHRMSGLAVLTHVPEHDLAGAQRMLGDACWTVTPDDIFADQDYHRLIRAVLSAIRGRDVLLEQEPADRRRVDPGPDWGYFERVATPLFHVEALTGDTSVQVTPAELARVSARATRFERLPALAVGLAGKEEVVVVPYEHFPPGFFRTLRLARVDVTLKGHFVVDANVVNRSIRGYCYLISFGKARYVVLGYLAFLGLAKRGLP